MDDPEVLNDLFLQAERGKKTLTQRDKAPFRVTHAGKQARVELDRAKFEEITRHLLDRTIELTREMLADAEGQGARAVRQDHPRRRRDPDAAGPRPARRRVRQGARGLRPRRGRRQGGGAVRPEGVAPGRGQGDPRPDRPRGRPARGAALDLDAVSEAQVAEALDQLEKQLGFTLTGPVRELVNTRIVNVLSKSLGVVARDDDEQGGRRLPPAPQRRGADGAAAPTSAPTPPTRPGVDIRVMAGERDSPEPADCKDVGTATLNLPDEPPRPEPDPRQVRHQPRRPPERHRHRPDRRRLDRRRVRDRGRHERRGGRGAVVGPAAADVS